MSHRHVTMYSRLYPLWAWRLFRDMEGRKSVSENISLHWNCSCAPKKMCRQGMEEEGTFGKSGQRESH